ncbi:MAG: hypothetical protein JNJ57_08670 [Saprospiraceae bacterium]|nr:hypothetical protein [Saprospiraceae bacterium]
MKHRCVFVFLLLSTAIFGQKHDYFQFFGYSSNTQLWGGATINFHHNPPAIYPEHKNMNFGLYCGICSDSSGVLAFYTNGIAIRDATHHIMAGGDTINPGPVWNQWHDDRYPNGPFCFGLPAPGQFNRYYFFHMGSTFTPVLSTSPFYFTLIDMEGNGGLGTVIKKNQVLLPIYTDYTAPVAVKHGNGRDWWVITGEVGKPINHRFLLNESGVHGPYTDTMPYFFQGVDYQSVNAMSPDGSVYVRGAGTLGFYVFDFDRCTGQLYNLRAVPFANDDFLCFATVFAPDSRHLYVSSLETVTVVDVMAQDISGSLDTVVYFDGNASPQLPFVTGFFNPNLAPDGKIYYSTTSSTLALHIINHPNLPGPAADFEQHGIALPKYNNGTMCLYPHYRLGEWESSPCDTINGQKPGDGFMSSAWQDNAIRNLKDYKILPPLFQKHKTETQSAPPEAAPSMIELSIQRRKERYVDEKTKKE